MKPPRPGMKVWWVSPVERYAPSIDGGLLAYVPAVVERVGEDGLVTIAAAALEDAELVRQSLTVPVRELAGRARPVPEVDLPGGESL